MQGQRIGQYIVGEKLGAGGMGEVFRARDSRLGRDVAIKVLPSIFAEDAQRLARFEREAQLLASLNHPNIATIHGLEEAGGVRAIVLELVEGPTLADRIQQGPLPLEEALPIAKQIAEALEYAHERGVIHRDLKPANVKLTSAGQVKILDFGLAKALEGETAAADISSSPTLTAAATRMGIILGTAAYMAPEQARGRAVDRRADIWSFGCVLYEMLSGKQPFPGEDVSETLAAIIKTDVDWGALPPSLPPTIQKLLRRCLEKDPKRRLQAIGEARIQIEEALGDAGASSVILAARPSEPAATWRRVMPWGMAGVMTLVAAVALALWLRAPAEQPRGVTRVAMAFPTVDRLGGGGCCGRLLGISPDGRRIAFGGSAGGSTRIFLRSMDQLEPTPLAGTENAATPFFSPDGKWVAFFSNGKLRKMSVEGGTPISLCDVAADPRGGSWGPDDTIVFAPTGISGLMRVPAAGGKPEPLTELDKQKNETSHRWPEFLPNGKAVLFTTVIGGNQFRVEAVSLATRERRALVENAGQPAYASSGHIIFPQIDLREGSPTLGSVLAVPFDPDALRLRGAAVPVLEHVLVRTGGAADFVLARDGTLALLEARQGSAQDLLVWVDRRGTVTPVSENRRSYDNPRLTSDGRHVLLEVDENPHGIWIYDLERGTLSRLTFDGDHHNPAPIPDGSRVAYSFQGKGIFWKRTDGTGREEQLSRSERNQAPMSWSPDGKLLSYVEWDLAGQPDIWLLPMEGDRKPRPFLQSRFLETRPEFSPDGRWLAYSSTESGRGEIYVQPTSGEGGKWQVSTSGGAFPVWSPNGRELFYRLENKVMVVDVQLQPVFRAGKPRVLFEGNFRNLFDVARDGQRFLMVQQPQAQTSREPQIYLTLNWFEELRQRVPGKK